MTLSSIWKKFEDYFEFVAIDPKNKEAKPSLIGYGYLDEIPEMQKRAGEGKEVRKKKIDIRTEYIFTTEIDLGYHSTA